MTEARTAPATEQIPGVRYDATKRKWKAQARIGGVVRNLGYHLDAADAADAIARTKAQHEPVHKPKDELTTMLRQRQTRSSNRQVVFLSNDFVCQPWGLNELQAKAFALTLASLNHKDDKDPLTIAFQVQQLFPNYEPKHYRELHRTVHALGDMMVMIYHNKHVGERINVFSQLKFDMKTGLIWGSFTPAIQPYIMPLLERGNFTAAQLADLLRIRGAAAHKLYWLLVCHARDGVGNWKEGYDSLRQLLCADKYPVFADFRRYILKPACDELTETAYGFTFHAVEEHRIGVRVTQVEFRYTYKATSVEKPAKPAKAGRAEKREEDFQEFLDHYRGVPQWFNLYEKMAGTPAQRDGRTANGYTPVAMDAAAAQKIFRYVVQDSSRVKKLIDLLNPLVVQHGLTNMDRVMRAGHVMKQIKHAFPDLFPAK
ncbi:Initiator Replication protein [Hymenobacter gelipurpurascens]|uniref:Initiator Replication protein n=2 Tax=Hymenobacter gelipurpurascens TaxID=89968 RepID=A0A212TGB3_9BACT|nr:Initiator Replication protein [Hymenobacter gelipurpurascens]